MLKKHFKDNGYIFDKIIIECSPFLKCMITAGLLATEFSQSEVTINYRAHGILSWQKIKEVDCKYITKKGGMVGEGSQYFPKDVQFMEPEDVKD